MKISQALAIAIEHHRCGRLDLAEEIYRRILAAEPDHADAMHLLGVAAHDRGEHSAAAELIGRAIALDAGQAHFHYNLGEAYRALGRSAEAAECYAEAVRLKPDYAEAHNNLGSVWQAQGDLERASASYQQAAAVKPDFAAAHYNLGVVLHGQGHTEEAAECYGRAIALAPEFTQAANNLGNALDELGRTAEAADCYRRALRAKPDDAETLYNLANVLKAEGETDEAIACYRRAIALEPNDAEFHLNFGNALKDTGALDEAVACYRQGMAVEPPCPGAHSALLCALSYRAGVTPAGLRSAHEEFQRRHAAPLRSTWRDFEGGFDPERRLRLGFVSADFCRHPVGMFLVRAMENLAGDDFDRVCYYGGRRHDELTARFQRAATAWHETRRLSDEALAERIRDDRIDILFDLAGHTGGSRVLVFARRPAPLQIAWIGHEGTTGLEAMDCLLADERLVPASAERFYVERVLRLPDGYVCFDPPDAPPVGPPPVQSEGRVTFGSFNNPAKIGPEVVAAWAEILRRVPGAKLVLKYRGLDRGPGRATFVERFAAAGVDPERVEFLGASPYGEHLAAYGVIDVGLDPFPFNGGATTCESLWMGVPVVTRPGETFASRHSLSYLTTVGLTETIAAGLDEYVALAVELATDVERLAELRAGLRERVAESPLCDGRRFAGNLANILRQVWRQRCERQ